MNHELKMNNNYLFEGLSYFDFKENIKALDTLIIYQWTKNNFPVFLNSLLRNFNEFNDTVAYFTARLMYGFNKYGMENDMYSKENREFYAGLKMPYSSILQYLRAKGKIISLPFFIDTSENINFAEKYAGRKVSNKIYQSALRFSVLFYIKNNYKNNFISSVVNIQNVSNEKVSWHVFLPFTFYYVKEVIINIKNHTADIYLEVIGKKEILEEKIKNGKEIEYNKNENIIQIKGN